MDGFIGFKVLDLDDLYTFQRSIKGPYLGVVYAIEYGDKIKIGCSKTPYSRIRSLKKWADGYGGISFGKVCVSTPHTNYREMESFFHKLFSRKRVQDTELFSITLNQFLNKASQYAHQFKDDSGQFEMRAFDACEALKSSFSGGSGEDQTPIKIILENPWRVVELYKDKIQKCEACIEILEDMCDAHPLDREKPDDYMTEVKRKEKLANDIIHSTNTISMHTLAAILFQNGTNVSQESLFDWMVENGFVNIKADGTFSLTEKSTKLDLLRIEPEEELPCITGKGQFYFVMLLLRNQEVDLSGC